MRSISTLKSVNESLAARSYLRPLKSYCPPNDLESQFKAVLQNCLIQSSSITSGHIKFKLLNACSKKFNHTVPNSRLHEIKTVGRINKNLHENLTSFMFFHFISLTDDVLDFYKLPVDGRVPLDKFSSVALPPNLYIQHEYHRFHPETDTLFSGVSAFPKQSTIVTGLKYKKKYLGYSSKPIWH